MTTYYLAGPVSLGGTCSPEQVAAFMETFTRVAARLRAEGHEALNPTELGERPSWLAYIGQERGAICACGHHRDVHHPKCAPWRDPRACSCERFTPTPDAKAGEDRRNAA